MEEGPTALLGRWAIGAAVLALAIAIGRRRGGWIASDRGQAWIARGIALVLAAIGATVAIAWQTATLEPVTAAITGHGHLAVLAVLGVGIGASQIAAHRLLGSCPTLRVLTTSREPLGIYGEAVLAIPSLALPAAVEQHDGHPVVDADALEQAARSEAVSLFLERARATLPAFVLDLANIAAVVEICRRLDGIPLAIELAAARVVAMSPRDIAARLDERFRLPLLTGGDDVRAFIPPDNVLGYVDALAAGVETGAASHAGAARDAGVILPATAKALGDVGIGIGAVIASVYYPARRLIAHAHVLERSAKAACRVRGWRSGFDFAIITNEDAMIEKPVRTGAGIGARPLAPRTPDWATALDRARALAKIPRAQIAALAATVGFVDECDPSGPPAAQPASDESELANLLRYQVARSGAWQAWYEACGIDWRDRNDVVVHRPTRDMLELARLLAFGGP
jgi:hypothetical protein